MTSHWFVLLAPLIGVLAILETVRVREWVAQVTELRAEGVELRMLMSAADAASAWDLRCEVREQLLTFLRERYPEALPRTRVEAVTAPLHVPPDWASLDLTRAPAGYPLRRSNTDD
jgi:hypothetical protein